MPSRPHLPTLLLSLAFSAAAMGAQQGETGSTDILEQAPTAKSITEADPNTPADADAVAASGQDPQEEPGSETPPAVAAGEEAAQAAAVTNAAEKPTVDSDLANKDIGSHDEAQAAAEGATAGTVEAAKEASKEEAPSEPEAPPEPEVTMADVLALLQAQQKQIDEQKTLLESQAQKIATLTRELDTLRAPPPVVALQEEIVAKEDAATLPVDMQAADRQAADIQAADSDTQAVAEVTTTELEEEKAVKAGDAVARAQVDDPTRALLEDFVGAWRLPGTNAALAIGGFVKANFVYNWDPLEINDRFIVGSIPVGVSGGVEEQSSMTANQSRLNFDLREPTEFGLLRAFIEADFAEDGDTFRLRHAFGQWKAVTAGKTWSAFVDTQASPEEVDFEGLNGRINVRQSQIRLAPKLGEQYAFQFSMEDPNPQVTNGSGVTRAPDFVFAGRFQPYDKLHTKVALLLRQIRAQPEDRGGVEKQYAWGLSVSGRYQMPRWDERDSLLFQLNGGNGIGRYVNDLSSVGDFDGIFGPGSGNLELFDIYSGYISFQHWWGRNQLRSNFTFGFVDINNPGFVDPSAYKTTVRASSNLFWSPTPRIDIGGEYLWGKRENENGNNADATQLQFAVRYRF